MDTIKFGYYQENDLWVRSLEEFPDYRTQGTSLDELKQNLKDIYRDLTRRHTSCSPVWETGSGMKRPELIKNKLK